MEIISNHGSIFWPRNLIRFLGAWASFMRVEVKLLVYEKYLSISKRLGIS
jgi:aarF domain-containing kinase